MSDQYMPPPGYGPAPIPGFPYPAPMAPPVPARAYAKREFEAPEAPATGSVVTAWLSLATRWSRANAAAWSQAAGAGWVRSSLIVTAILALVSGVGSGLVLLLNGYQLPNSTFPPAQTVAYHPYTVGNVITSSVTGFLDAFGAIFALALVMALFMNSQFYGSFAERFSRALKPIALASVSIAFLSLIVTLLSAFLQVLENPSLIALSQAAKQQPPDTVALQNSLGPILGFSCLTLLVAAGALTFEIGIFTTAAGVGGNKSRWAAFGIGLIGLVAWGIISNGAIGTTLSLLLH